MTHRVWETPVRNELPVSSSFPERLPIHSFGCNEGASFRAGHWADGYAPSDPAACCSVKTLHSGPPAWQRPWAIAGPKNATIFDSRRWWSGRGTQKKSQTRAMIGLEAQLTTKLDATQASGRDTRESGVVSSLASAKDVAGRTWPRGPFIPQCSPAPGPPCSSRLPYDYWHGPRRGLGRLLLMAPPRPNLVRGAGEGPRVVPEGWQARPRHPRRENPRVLDRRERSRRTRAPVPGRAFAGLAGGAGPNTCRVDFAAPSSSFGATSSHHPSLFSGSGSVTSQSVGSHRSSPGHDFILLSRRARSFLVAFTMHYQWPAAYLPEKWRQLGRLNQLGFPATSPARAPSETAYCRRSPVLLLPVWPVPRRDSERPGCPPATAGDSAHDPTRTGCATQARDRVRRC